MSGKAMANADIFRRETGFPLSFAYVNLAGAQVMLR